MSNPPPAAGGRTGRAYCAGVAAKAGPVEADPLYRLRAGAVRPASRPRRTPEPGRPRAADSRPAHGRPLRGLRPGRGPPPRAGEPGCAGRGPWRPPRRDAGRRFLRHPRPRRQTRLHGLSGRVSRLRSRTLPSEQPPDRPQNDHKSARHCGLLWIAEKQRPHGQPHDREKGNGPLNQRPCGQPAAPLARTPGYIGSAVCVVGLPLVLPVLQLQGARRAARATLSLSNASDSRIIPCLVSSATAGAGGRGLSPGRAFIRHRIGPQRTCAGQA